MVDMLLPEKMCKIEIISLKENREKIMQRLYSLGLLHLEEVVVEGKAIAINEEERQIIDMDNKTESFFYNLEKLIKVKEPKRHSSISKKEISRGYSLINKFSEMFRDIEVISEDIVRLKDNVEIIDLLLKLNINDLKHVKTIDKHTVVIGYANKENSRKLKDLLRKLKDRGLIEGYVREDKDRDYFLIVSLKNKDVDIGELVSYLDVHHDIHELYNRFKDIETNVYNLYNLLSTEIETLHRKYNSLIDRIEKEFESNKNLLWNLRYYLRDRTKQIEGYSFLKEKDYVFIVRGYVPCKNKEKVVNSVKKIDKYALIRVQEAEPHEAPVKLKYPKFLRGVHFLLEAYGLPAYRYIDPSLFMLITFPLFYGFILGDFGYGLVLFLLSFILMRTKSNAFKLLGQVFLYASLSTIFFGLLFGEFFGFEELFGYKLPALMHRMEKINELIIISLLFGIVHVNLGLVLGIVQDFIYRQYLHALTHRMSWILLQIGVGLIGYGMYISSSFISYFGGVLFLLSVGMLYYAERLQAIFELPSIFTNILSYARLGAVGLSSIAIAYVINVFAEMFFEKHVLWAYFVGGLIFLIGHTFNIVLGIISPFLHSLRLHYVEHFTKFYKSGGVKFTPYGKTE